MVKLKYTKWNEIPISVYKKIVDVCNDEEAMTSDKNVSTMAILCDVDESEIYNLSVGECQELMGEIDFVNTFDYDRTYKGQDIKLGKYKFKVNTDLSKFTVAQYIDFQNLFNPQDMSKNMAQLMRVFMIPEGKKYGEDYDVNEVLSVIENCLPITTAQSILFFFATSLATSTRNTAKSLESTLKKMITETNDETERMKIAKELNRVRATLHG